jgi:hypothetical protein
MKASAKVKEALLNPAGLSHCEPDGPKEKKWLNLGMISSALERCVGSVEVVPLKLWTVERGVPSPRQG